MELGEEEVKQPKVLIVDDLSFMRGLLRDILVKNGFPVIEEAENGKTAVEKYYRFRPDLVLLDITMPVMDGLTALNQIIRFDGKARVIICSSLGQQKYVIRAIQLGAKDFVVKPFTEERIVSALQKALLR